MFKDKVRLKFQAGKGGRGKVSFYSTGKPSGGVGGNGGNVYLEGAINLYDLSHIKTDTLFRAEDGVEGGENNKKGREGKDVIIKVPLITHVYNEKNELVMTIDKPNEPKLLLKGGIGGLGNWFFRTKGLSFLETYQPGAEGERAEGFLELELYSDIIFIGFPNAGKSSILNALTNAESKVAPYAFTTIDPHLGRLDGITLMDLPGLIEGTYEGKGLGTKFVKHTRAAKYVAHMISLENENVVEVYKKIRDELKNIDENLFNKPEVIILTKSDLVKPEDIKAKIAELKKYNKEIKVCSVYDYDSLEELKSYFKKLVSA